MEKAGKIFLALAGLLGITFLATREAKAAQPVAHGASVGLRILTLDGEEVPHNSPVNLIEGLTYIWEITIINTSTIGGALAAADLDMTGSIYYGADVYGPVYARATYPFLAGESKVFSKAFTVPYGRPGGNAKVYVIQPGTFPPSEVLLAQATEPITILPGLLYGAQINQVIA